MEINSNLDITTQAELQVVIREASSEELSSHILNLDSVLLHMVAEIKTRAEQGDQAALYWSEHYARWYGNPIRP